MKNRVHIVSELPSIPHSMSLCLGETRGGTSGVKRFPCVKTGTKMTFAHQEPMICDSSVLINKHACVHACMHALNAKLR
jgi:hypothetical protein